MLPKFAEPFTEIVVGAGLGALAAKFMLKGDATTGALVGAVAGYGVMLSKAKGAFPFTAVSGEYVGDSVTQFPTYQQGYAQPYGGYQLQQQPVQPAGQEIIEEVIPEYIPEGGGDWDRWRRRERGWGRGYGRGYGHGGWGHGGWGHGWRR
jgi:hypothetical protein